MAVTSSFSPGFSLQWNMVVLYNLGGRSLIFFFTSSDRWRKNVWCGECPCGLLKKNPRHNSALIAHHTSCDLLQISRGSPMLTDVTPDNRGQFSFSHNSCTHCPAAGNNMLMNFVCEAILTNSINKRTWCQIPHTYCHESTLHDFFKLHLWSSS